MPELPEVETIKNELLPHIIGKCITGVTLFWERIVRHPSAEEFCSRLIGQRITGITRRGKYLLFDLTGKEALIIHLKMSGSLLLQPVNSEPHKFDRAILNLGEETALHFRDPRKFGSMWLVEDRNAVIGSIGPEPLGANFTPQVLVRLLSNRTAPIKAILCDQAFIAGIGNMYADEALFAAKIHPLRTGKSLSTEEVERLHCAIQQVLRSAIGNKGASIVNYFRPDGTLGTAHFEFKVAHRRGETCDCGTPIERIPVRNRGTYFCPRCQQELVKAALYSSGANPDSFSQQRSQSMRSFSNSPGRQRGAQAHDKKIHSYHNPFHAKNSYPYYKEFISIL